MFDYIVMDKAAPMRRGYGGYRRVAVVKVDRVVLPQGEPRMISTRARGCVEVMAEWPQVATGKTERCAHARALRAARELAADLRTREALRGGGSCD